MFGGPRPRVWWSPSARLRGRPRKDAIGWHALPVPLPISLPNYAALAQQLPQSTSPHPSPPQPSLPHPSPPQPSPSHPSQWSERHGTFLPIEGGTAVAHPAAMSGAESAGPPMPTQPAPANMQRSAAMQLQHEVERRQEKQQAPIDREAALPQPLLHAVRDMWQHFGWLRGEKLRRELVERRNEPGSGKPLPPSLWLDALPSDLRHRLRNDCLQPASERLLPLALRLVREERRAAGLSVFDRAPNKHGWRRVSGPCRGFVRVSVWRFPLYCGTQLLRTTKTTLATVHPSFFSP